MTNPPKSFADATALLTILDRRYIYQVPLFRGWRAQWETNDDLKEKLTQADNLARKRNELACIIPTYLALWDVQAILEPELSTPEELANYNAVEERLSSMAPRFWYVFMPRWIRLEYALAHSMDRGSVGGAALCLRALLEEAALLIGIVTLYRRISDRTASLPDAVNLVNVIHHLFGARTENPVPKRDFRRLTNALRTSAETDAQVRRALSSVEQQRRLMNDLVHPNVGSHQAILEPDNVDTALLVITAFLNIYANWNDFGIQALADSTPVIVAPEFEAEPPVSKLWDKFLAAIPDVTITERNGGVRSLRAEFPTPFSHVNPQSGDNQFWAALSRPSINTSFGEWGTAGVASPGAAEVLASAKNLRNVVTQALKTHRRGGTKEGREAAIIERRMATREAMSLYVTLFVAKAQHYIDLWLAMNGSKNGIGAALFARAALESAGSLFVFRESLGQINAELESIDISAEAVFSLTGKGATSHAEQAKALLSKLDEAVWTILTSRANVELTTLDWSWLQGASATRANFDEFLPSEMKVHHDMLSEICHGSYSRAAFELPGKQAEFLILSLWAAVYADDFATDSYRRLAPERGVIEAFLMPSEPWQGERAWRSAADANAYIANYFRNGRAPLARAWKAINRATILRKENRFIEASKQATEAISILSEVSNPKRRLDKLYFSSAAYEARGMIEMDDRNFEAAYADLLTGLNLAEQVRQRLGANVGAKSDWGINEQLGDTVSRLLSVAYDLAINALQSRDVVATKKWASTFMDYAQRYAHLGVNPSFVTEMTSLADLPDDYQWG